jgi:hypothetical protein
MKLHGRIIYLVVMESFSGLFCTEESIKYLHYRPGYNELSQVRKFG